MKRSDDRPSGPKKPLAGSAGERLEAIVEGAERAAEKVIDEAEQQARAYVAEAEADADRAVAERLAAVGELAEALLAQADAIRRQAELLSESLREAKGRLGGAEDSGGTEGPGRAGGSGGPEDSSRAEDSGRAEDSIHADEPSCPEEDEAEAPAAKFGERRTGGSPGAPWRLGPAPETRTAPADAPRAPHLTPVDSARPVDPRFSEERPGVAVARDERTPAGARLLATQMAVSGSSREEIVARLRSGFEIEDTDAILDAILGPES